MVFNRIDCLVRQSVFYSQGYVNKLKCRRHKVYFDLVNESVVFLKLNLVNVMRVYCSICVQCTAFAV